ncbi:MAG: zinc/iron-chelating domain-containing protein [Desulfovibrio sp.]|nr:zinc/iron-chelating domain-containing protein [Desulfovibrio sp.]MCA1985141.1 zinc/iron-chelating domain-containing protein [Desulfovibrio sp.]
MPACNTPPDILAFPPTPHVCARCAKCCVVVPGDEDMLFPLFEEEVARLEAAAHELIPGVSPVAPAPNSPAFLAAMLRLFPDDALRVRELIPEAGRHMQLAVTGTGACVFLGDHGCRLPRDVRPAHCLLFPFWFHRNRLRVLEADCLAIREAGAIWKLLQTLDLKEADLREAFGRLRRIWGLPPMI